MRRFGIVTAMVLAVCLGTGFATGADKGGIASIQPEPLKEWLTYLSSDDLEGRATFTEGLGLAAAYIADQLKAAGVKPGGDHGTYFQRVSVIGVKATPRSTMTVDVNGQTRTFKDGEGFTLPRNAFAGGKRTFTADQIEFVGYGLNVSAANYNDYAGRNVKGKVVVWLGPSGPKNVEGAQFGRALRGRARYAIDEAGAVASIGPELPAFGGRGGAAASTPPSTTAAAGRGEAPGGAAPATQGRGRGAAIPPDFTTVQRLDAPIPPVVTANDDFLEFLFSTAPEKYSTLKAKAASREPLAPFTVSNVTITFNIDNEYQIVNTQYTRNVVGIVEGSDPRVKDTYVAFGAHYDHVGYSQGPLAADADRISNGADDDGSGTATLIGVARAFALAPHPKRSLIFVWHAGEERGLLGSRYMADYPSVPTEKIVAQLNADMIGRDRDNKPEESNSVYPVGSDRISTELHNILIDANAALAKPLKLDFEMNDPTDLEQIYYRSDHYSYAAKGIPIIFWTTGLHPDYHRVTDTVEKINFDKMARIGQLMFETGRRVATLDHAPVRDNKGPRAGKTVTGKLTQ
jgi:peptidase M28-like protein